MPDARRNPPSARGHRARLRRRFAGAGLRSLLDYEALELLLTFALPRVDTKPIAKDLLKRFGGLWGVFGASEGELREVKGVGPRAACLIVLMRDLCAACLRDGLRGRDVLASESALADYARVALAARPDETVLALFLDARRGILAEEVVGEGTVDRASVFPRRVIERALAWKASGIVLVHNHPGGRAEPSAEDDLLTRRLKSAAEAVELRLLDHLIVSRSEWYSYKANGVLLVP
jgi:DNA repair protein RadC